MTRSGVIVFLIRVSVLPRDLYVNADSSSYLNKANRICIVVAVVVPVLSAYWTCYVINIMNMYNYGSL